MRNFSENEKVSLLEDIDTIRSENIEQMWLMTKEAFSLYIRSLLVYGRKSRITKDNLNIIKEFFRIAKEETNILNYIANNIDDIDYDAAIKFIDKLDILNEKTFMYYYEALDDIETACETKIPQYAIRLPRKFSALTDTSIYRREVVALTETDKTIREQLQYEDKFWGYIDRIIKRVNVSTDILKDIVYVRPIYDSDDLVGGIDMLIPEVVDLDSSLIAIELYQKAYAIYCSIGCKTVFSQEDEEMFPILYQDYYLDEKVTLAFKKRV